MNRDCYLDLYRPVSYTIAVEKIFEPVNGYYLSITSLAANKRYALAADGTPLSPDCGFTVPRDGSPLRAGPKGTSKVSRFSDDGSLDHSTGGWAGNAARMSYALPTGALAG